MRVNCLWAGWDPNSSSAGPQSILLLMDLEELVQLVLFVLRGRLLFDG